MINFLNKIKKALNRKTKELDYPTEFLMVTYTSYALEDGTTDDSNKIIIHYWIDEFDNQRETKYRYSAERLQSLKENYRIPVYDKTKTDIALPVFSKLIPGELQWLESKNA